MKTFRIFSVLLLIFCLKSAAVTAQTIGTPGTPSHQNPVLSEATGTIVGVTQHTLFVSVGSQTYEVPYGKINTATGQEVGLVGMTITVRIVTHPVTGEAIAMSIISSVIG